ncbi:MAG: hypothetical protein AAB317_04105 [Nitrospirota bacterium]
MAPPLSDRRNEWFVPQFGPEKFRIAVGLLFLPYTGMVLSYSVIGAMLAPIIHWDRVVAIVLIYFFGLGIAAHALDAIGGSDNGKPWGNHFSKKGLIISAGISLLFAYGIGIYYIVTTSGWLLVIALLEGFFLFAYNLELFHGRFHTDFWFAFSWGTLPVFAGFVMQTNSLSFPAFFVAIAMGGMSFVEINASRPYKALKRSGESRTHLIRYETILKSLSLSVILLGIGMILWRW